MIAMLLYMNVMLMSAYMYMHVGVDSLWQGMGIFLQLSINYYICISRENLTLYVYISH